MCSKYVKVTMICLLLSFTEVALSKECKTDKGLLTDPFAFGSTEQLKQIQKHLLEGCDLIGILYQPNKVTYNLLALDLKQKKIMRFTKLNDGTGQKPSWEGWSGFSKKQVLDDDPADGFDLPNYKSGRGTKVSSSILSNDISRIMMELVEGRK